MTTYTSRLGERRGIQWLMYNPLQLLAYHRLAAREAPGVARAFTRVFPDAGSFVDVGAGSGVYASELRRLGVRVEACEHARAGRFVAKRLGVRSVPFDLVREPPAVLAGPFDVAYSIEVAEHVSQTLGERLVRLLLDLAPTVVFTAARPGQGGLGHVNEQPPGYWIECFERLGGCLDLTHTKYLRETCLTEGVRAPWLTENAVVFVRADSNGVAQESKRH
jgi:hypothetical protein